jgi:excisionase family DNA binding protein
MSDIKFLSVTKIAEEFNVKKQTVIRWIRSNRIQAIKTPGGHWRVSEYEIEKLRIGLVE